MTSPRFATLRQISRYLFLEQLESRLLLASIGSVNPLANSHSAAISTDISASFDEMILPNSATRESFVIQSQLRATEVDVSASGNTIVADPSVDFFPGDLVQVTATSRIQGESTAVIPAVWQFRTAVQAGSGQFVSNGQSLGNHNSRDVSLGDLDGDGDLDAFVSARNEGNRVWLNSGGGTFNDGGQSLGATGSIGVSLGDLDGDGDLDAFVANFGEANRVWLNNGSGLFNDSGQTLGTYSSVGVSLGDLDRDGDLDAFVTNFNDYNRVWLNGGGGQFVDSGQRLGFLNSAAVSLGDLDGDGNLDAFVANISSQGNQVWLNNGGLFYDSGQSLGNRNSQGVSLGDLDSDGDLDAFVSNNDDGRIWINDGGVFFDSGQSLPSQDGRGISLGDLDGDGDLDAYVANNGGNRAWLNDGGVFSDSGQILGDHRSRGVALGDLDGDGDLDGFVGNPDGQGNRVWINQNLTPSVVLGIDDLRISEDGGAATVTATLSAAHSQPVTVDLNVTGTATATDDYTISGTQIVIPAGASTGSTTITTVQDTLDEPDETVIFEIASITNGQAGGTRQVTISIVDDDDPPTVDLALDSPGMAENGGVVTATATLSMASGQDVAINITAAGSATLGADYTLSDTQIAIVAGSTSGSIVVTSVDDAIEEQDETVDLTITATNATVGVGAQSVTILDDEVPPSFRLSSLTPTSSGFFAELSAAVDASVLNLSDTQTGGRGPADATLVGAITGAIAGSLVVSPDGRRLEFLATGARLAADSYMVTLRSGDNGLRDTEGNLLDGNGDGTGGDDFNDTFTVGSNTSEIGVQDFVRGAGQELNLPANSNEGIPITIDSDGAAIRNASFVIGYNPNLLNITGIWPGANMPSGSTATVDTSTPGQSMVVFMSPTDLPAGLNALVNLQANVPTVSANYGSQHVLDIHSITLTNSAGVELPAIDNDGLHVAAFFGDVSGNGGINASDASQVARVAASLDTGFAEFLLTDPMIVGDVSGNGVINATDASMVARHAVELPVDEIPPIPGGVVVASSGRVGPKQSLGTTPTAFVPSPVTIHDRSKPPKALGFTVPVVVPHAAIDAMMARLENSAADNDQLLPALKDAVEQLFTASLPSRPNRGISGAQSV